MAYEQPPQYLYESPIYAYIHVYKRARDREIEGGRIPDGLLQTDGSLLRDGEMEWRGSSEVRGSHISTLIDINEKI